MRKTKIFFKYVQVCLLNELQYRANFFLQLFFSVTNLAFALAVLYLIFSRVTSLNGWTRQEVFLLVGVYHVVQGVITLILSSSLARFMESINSGSFDFTLLKPVEAQFLSSISRIQIWKIIDILTGVIIISYALIQLNLQLSFLQVAAFLIMLSVGVLVLSSLYLIVATSAFWFIGVTNLLAIFPQCFEWAGRWPVTVYPGWLRLILTFIVPVGFAVTVPTESLLGRLNFGTVFYAILICVAFFSLARVVWKLDLRKYSGASA